MKSLTTKSFKLFSNIFHQSPEVVMLTALVYLIVTHIPQCIVASQVPTTQPTMSPILAVEATSEPQGFGLDFVVIPTAIGLVAGAILIVSVVQTMRKKDKVEGATDKIQEKIISMRDKAICLKISTGDNGSINDPIQDGESIPDESGKASFENPKFKENKRVELESPYIIPLQPNMSYYQNIEHTSKSRSSNPTFERNDVAESDDHFDNINIIEMTDEGREGRADTIFTIGEDEEAEGDGGKQVEKVRNSSFIDIASLSSQDLEQIDRDMQKRKSEHLKYSKVPPRFNITVEEEIKNSRSLVEKVKQDRNSTGSREHKRSSSSSRPNSGEEDVPEKFNEHRSRAEGKGKSKHDSSGRRKSKRKSKTSSNKDGQRKSHGSGYRVRSNEKKISKDATDKRISGGDKKKGDSSVANRRSSKIEKRKI